MDQMLKEAARVGDVITLHKLLEEDPQVLKKACLTNFAESPLHAATLANRGQFVREIITRMPSLATLPNQKGLIPLHMASAAEQVDIVKELLSGKLNSNEVKQCLVKDEDGWTALHYAVFRGRVDVMEELMRYCAERMEEVTVKGETVLHLAIKANQLEAMKVIMERIRILIPNFQTLLGAKDINGKTIYDLAKAKKQFQVVLGIGKEEEMKNDEIREETSIAVVDSAEDGQNPKTPKKEEKEEHRKREFKNAILVVVTTIMTLTYEGVSDPPSSLIKEGTEIHRACLSARKHGLIKDMKNCPSKLAFELLFFNTLIFFESTLYLLFTFRGRRAVLLGGLFIHLIAGYSIFLMAFSYYTAYVAIPLCLIAYFVITALIFATDREMIAGIVKTDAMYTIIPFHTNLRLGKAS
ncbi:ankyrin repeat-containing protein At2g01680-like [Prosopis cineraria]|uniref:ankyrin repeat-containing protein At2g01680-like n=1 Tax=Prosopis cineraria TaxID=364024 RepID=UPI00240EE58F|nr:ankyrin repeat-containing protein At2g01680-like [Prosopis cineraria]